MICKQGLEQVFGLIRLLCHLEKFGLVLKKENGRHKCARELARAGLRVAICEANDYVGGATGAAMGHLAVMDDSEAQFALTNFSQRLWRESADELPAHVEYRPCGSLWVAADEEELAEVERKFGFYYSNRGVPVEILDSKRVCEAEPNLRPGLAGALLMCADSVCYPPCAARYFAEEAVASGGQLLLNRTVMQVAGSAIACSRHGRSWRSDTVSRRARSNDTAHFGIPLQQLAPALPPNWHPCSRCALSPQLRGSFVFTGQYFPYFIGNLSR